MTSEFDLYKKQKDDIIANKINQYTIDTVIYFLENDLKYDYCAEVLRDTIKIAIRHLKGEYQK